MHPERRRAPYPHGAPRERRRERWREFRHAYPGIVATMLASLVVLLAADAWLIYKHVRYTREVDRLRAGMTDVERRKADAVIASEQQRLRVMIELARRQAQGDRTLHLAVALDSSRMVLERDGARLRVMPVEVGPERWVRVGADSTRDSVRMAAPRGERTVLRILGDSDAWEVPPWAYRDRALPVPGDRRVTGALGPVALVLDGGAVIYSPPMRGPLNDPSYVLPGSIRARTEDLRAIAPNLTPGMTVYLY
jgi:hypothetical protein